MREVELKTGKYDELQQAYEGAMQKLDEAVQQNEFLSKKTNELMESVKIGIRML